MEQTERDAMRKLAEAATPQAIDTAEIKKAVGAGENIECPTCQGDGHVELEADYCNYDNTAIGVTFYGIGNAHGAAEDYFRAVTPAKVIELLDAMDAQALRIAELEKDRDEWKESTMWANENARREESKRRNMQDERDTISATLDAVLKGRDELRVELETVLKDRVVLALQVESLHSELEALRAALVYVAHAGHSTKQYMLPQGVMLLDNDGVVVRVPDGPAVWGGRVPEYEKNRLAAPVAPAKPLTDSVMGLVELLGNDPSATKQIDSRAWAHLSLYMPAQPLTDADILGLFEALPVYDVDMIYFARAIEAAHGIKGQA